MKLNPILFNKQIAILIRLKVNSTFYSFNRREWVCLKVKCLYFESKKFQRNKETFGIEAIR